MSTMFQFGKQLVYKQMSSNSSSYSYNTKPKYPLCPGKTCSVALLLWHASILYIMSHYLEFVSGKILSLGGKNYSVSVSAIEYIV